MNRRDALTRMGGVLGATASLALTTYAPLAKSSPPVDAGLLAAWADHARPTAFFAGRVESPVSPIRLPTRPHGIAVHPEAPSIAYVCARRPGEYLWKVDLADGRIVAEIEADDSFRFEGHAIVDAGRSLVYTTQSELEHGEGRIGVYDAATLEPRGSCPSGGIGPHELVRLASDRIAVAHGGILTLPETGRVKRNLAAMEPSLVIVDTKLQAPIAQHRLADRTMGIRHLTVAANGTLGIALQNEGTKPRSVFAVFDGERLILGQAPPESASDLGNYGASVASVDERFAVTCTRADRVASFDSNARLLNTAPMRAPSGIAAIDGAFVASNEFGEIVVFDAKTLVERSRERYAGRRWDNHLLSAFQCFPCEPAAPRARTVAFTSI